MKLRRIEYFRRDDLLYLIKTRKNDTGRCYFVTAKTQLNWSNWRKASTAGEASEKCCSSLADYWLLNNLITDLWMEIDPASSFVCTNEHDRSFLQLIRASISEAFYMAHRAHSRRKTNGNRGKTPVVSCAVLFYHGRFVCMKKTQNS